jgi:hypothetical protein
MLTLSVSDTKGPGSAVLQMREGPFQRYQSPPDDKTVGIPFTVRLQGSVLCGVLHRVTDKMLLLRLERSEDPHCRISQGEGGGSDASRRVPSWIMKDHEGL